ncbi:uncharacterized protein LOC135395739 [Ornithodoros turicata]|uniref:uncharacterized protein LOC135395739 n=1 Tax=Ornithodoros turicata TaxID=34597 RepID=UPI003139E022
MVKATISCPNSHITKWCIQPSIQGKPLGNILLCCAIFFSGGSPTQLLPMFFMGIRTIQKTQFLKFQRCYMLPAVTEVWQLEQSQLLQQLKGRELCLAGDGRADSPGHSADFGTYSLLETDVNRIIHVELVKSTEVSSSNRMEREGLERALAFLNQQDVSISMLVTDRHTEVKAFMKRTYSTIRHRFDVWHVAKGIKKKLVAAAAGKRHNVIQKWCPTIPWC